MTPLVVRLACLTAAAALVACAANSAEHVPPSPTTQITADNAWTVTLHQSGGFAGVNRELTLTSKGELRVSDRRRSLQAATQLAPNELSQVAALVASAQPVEAASQSRCNDCFQYDLSVQSNGRTLTSSLNDLSLAGTPVEPLVRLLTSVLNRELAKQPITQGK